MNRAQRRANPKCEICKIAYSWCAYSNKTRGIEKTWMCLPCMEKNYPDAYADQAEAYAFAQQELEKENKRRSLS